MSEELKEYQASPELQKFFQNLLSLKAEILIKAKETESEVLQEIHDRLHEIIKKG